MRTLDRRTARAIVLVLGLALLPGIAPSATRPAVADLRVTALSVPPSARLGSSVTVGFSVRNTGPGAARATALAVNVPKGASFESVVASGGRCAGKTCVLGTLRSRSVRTIRVTIKPSTIGFWTVSARVSSRTRDPRPANNSAIVRAKVVGDDFVKGSGSRPFHPAAPPVFVEVDAISGPGGEDPSGTFSTRYPVGAWIQSGVELRGEVVCLTVAANRARVGGIVQQSNDARYPAGTGVWLAITDNASPGAGRDTQLTYFGGGVDPRVCTIPEPGSEFPEAVLVDGDFAVHDEQP